MMVISQFSHSSPAEGDQKTTAYHLAMVLPTARRPRKIAYRSTRTRTGTSTVSVQVAATRPARSSTKRSHHRLHHSHLLPASSIGMMAMAVTASRLSPLNDFTLQILAFPMRPAPSNTTLVAMANGNLHHNHNCRRYRPSLRDAATSHCGLHSVASRMVTNMDMVAARARPAKLWISSAAEVESGRHRSFPSFAASVAENVGPVDTQLMVLPTHRKSLRGL